MDEKRNMIYLAALLHDIGKFYQRADKNGTQNSDLLSELSKNSESSLCPSYKGIYSHKHVLWTVDFFEKFSSQFKNLVKTGHNISIERLASAHHNPDYNNLYEKIIQKADWHSSGVDRSTDEFSINDGLDENQWDSFKKKRMVSVFEGINSNNNDFKYSLPVTEISLLKAEFFPKQSHLFTQNPDYKKLWGDFIKEFKFIQSENIKVFADTLLNLLAKYTTNIPSSTIHLPDVSLYDHLKTTAAFALSLYDYLKENQYENLPLKDDEKPYLLIAGDISGIQDFIYDIISKNAAKNLKGRSFYLQLLTDSIIKKILNELDLFKANLVYGSGGSFFIVAANTQENKNKLDKINKEITEKIFAEHNTSLFLAITSIEFGEQHLFSKNGKTIGTLWEEAFKKLDILKQQRYINDLKNNYNAFFAPMGIGGKEKRDAITGEEITKNVETEELAEGEVKKSTYQQISLGKHLRDSDFWVISDKKIDYWKKDKEYNPAQLGVYHYFLTKDEIEKNRENLKASADSIEIISINDKNSKKDGNIDFLDTPISGHDNKFGFVFYGGNDFPFYEKTFTDEEGEKHYKGEPKSFDKYVGDVDFKRLGILRMDVDNLGQIFSKGFATKKQTFSRLSTLSRSLDYFFKGYLNTIWKQYNENTFILYSGGDDLFIVGKWDVVIKMAKQIRNDFIEYTCYNPKMSISGGVAIVTSKFPILKSSEFAADAELNAKEYDFNGKEKDAFSLMGLALNWDIEYPAVKKLKEELKKLIQNNNLPKSVLGNIYKFYEIRIQQIKKGKNPSWLWLLTYNIARMIPRVKDEDGKKLLHRIKNDVFTNSWNGTKHNFKYHTLEMVNIAARWAELEIRSN